MRRQGRPRGMSPSWGHRGHVDHDSRDADRTEHCRMPPMVTTRVSPDPIGPCRHRCCWCRTGWPYPANRRTRIANAEWRDRRVRVRRRNGGGSVRVGRRGRDGRTFGWSCAVIVSVPDAVAVLPAVYVIDDGTCRVAPTRCGVLVKISLRRRRNALTAVAVPPEPAARQRKVRKASGTGCGVGVELSTRHGECHLLPGGQAPCRQRSDWRRIRSSSTGEKTYVSVLQTA